MDSKEPMSRTAILPKGMEVPNAKSLGGSRAGRTVISITRREHPKEVLKDREKGL